MRVHPDNPATSAELRHLPLALRPGPGETLDAICGGAVQVLQRRGGYRFNLDPLLLAHFAAREVGITRGPLLDLGTGSGILALVLARRFGVVPVTGLELQPRLFALAERNVHLNRCEREVSLVLGDLRQVAQKFAPASFPHVVCNPPYRSRATGRTNPDVERAIARHELTCSLEDVSRAAAYLLTERGGLALVYPASRLADLTAALRAERLEPRTLRLVHPRPRRPAILVLVHAIKGARADLTVLPPLVLHPEDTQGYSAEVSAMLV